MASKEAACQRGGRFQPRHKACGFGPSGPKATLNPVVTHTLSSCSEGRRWTKSRPDARIQSPNSERNSGFVKGIGSRSRARASKPRRTITTRVRDDHAAPGAELQRGRGPRRHPFGRRGCDHDRALAPLLCDPADDHHRSRHRDACLALGVRSANLAPGKEHHDEIVRMPIQRAPARTS